MTQNVRVETLIQQGYDQLERGQYQAAIVSFDKAIELKADDHKAWYSRGIALDNLGRFEEAIASCDKALALNSDCYQALYCRGNALRELERYEEALASYDQALKIKPDFPKAWTNRGFALADLQRYEEAISSCDQALKIQIDFPEAWIAWNKRGIALAQLQRYEEALASYDKALEIKPDFQEAWCNRGKALWLLGRYEEAVASCDKALALDSDCYEAWYNRGIALNDLGRYEEAVASYDQALQLRRDLSAVWCLRGNALSKLQQYKEAIISYDRGLAIESDFYFFWLRRGSALFELHQYEEALNSYEKALKIKPDYQKAWFNRGLALNNLGRDEEAIISYDKALAIQPNDEIIDAYKIWYNRGKALEELNRYEQAIASYDQAIKIKPDLPEAWTNRGSVLYALQRHEEAIRSYDQALTININFSEAWKAWWGRGQAAGQSARCEPLFACLSPIATRNPALNKRGYEGALASYQEGVKYIQQDTHPEGWGCLQWKIGNTHYFRGNVDSRPFSYWYKAVKSYNEALKTLTQEAFPELHLEILQDLVKAKLGLGQKAEAEELQRRGSDLLRRLLNDPNRSDSSKKQLALNFVGFNQLTVDLAVQSGQMVKALEVAEEGKNACLTWLLYAWSDEIPKPNWEEIKQLVNPKAAVVYWHLSLAALTTFILKHNAPEPIVIGVDSPNSPDKRGLGEGKSSIFSSQEVRERSKLNFPSFQGWLEDILNKQEIPQSLRRLQEFEDWVKEWNQQYIDYRSKAKYKESRSNHPWRGGMEQRLEKLKNILNIPAIEQELTGISQLILIPHRDLHIFPLHALFSDAFTITYLPSVQIGINLQQRQSNPTNHLLSVEHPISQGLTSLEFAKIESESISQIFDQPKRIQSEHATKKQVEDALSDEYSIFHFTGHAIHNFTNPKKSELYLAGEDKLTLEEICQKILINYNLVALSACETAITGNQTITTEYVGLVSGFLSQGVAHVVSTLWTVESAATALVMIEFYRRRQVGKSEARALAEATQWLKELTVQQLKKWYEAFLIKLPLDELRISAFIETELERLGRMKPDKKLYNHPYYWAAFTITGKPC